MQPTHIFSVDHIVYDCMHVVTVGVGDAVTVVGCSVGGDGGGDRQDRP